MSKYKAGDKVVLEITGINELGAYKFGNTMYSWLIAKNFVDEYAKPLSEYTEKLEKKNENKQKRIEKLVERLHRQAAEITRLLKENAELKNSLEIIRDNAFEAGQVKGQNEAWELAKKIYCMPEDGGFHPKELIAIFGTVPASSILRLNTYYEAAAKVAEWERQKEEICVGDIVRFKENHRVEFCVTDIYDDRFLYGINADGGVYADRDIEHFEKTGRHIDIKSMLAQIGGGSDE